MNQNQLFNAIHLRPLTNALGQTLTRPNDIARRCPCRYKKTISNGTVIAEDRDGNIRTFNSPDDKNSVGFVVVERNK